MLRNPQRTIRRKLVPAVRACDARLKRQTDLRYLCRRVHENLVSLLRGDHVLFRAGDEELHQTSKAGFNIKRLTAHVNSLTPPDLAGSLVESFHQPGVNRTFLLFPPSPAGRFASMRLRQTGDRRMGTQYPNRPAGLCQCLGNNQDTERDLFHHRLVSRPTFGVKRLAASRADTRGFSRYTTGNRPVGTRAVGALERAATTTSHAPWILAGLPIAAIPVFGGLHAVVLAALFLDVRRALCVPVFASVVFTVALCCSAKVQHVEPSQRCCRKNAYFWPPGWPAPLGLSAKWRETR